MTSPLTHPVTIFAMLALLLLLVPLLARALRLPAMVGLILAGVVVGPNGLNVLDKSPGLDLLATAGLLYIMFTAGLEMDLQQFRRQRVQAVTFGLLIFGLAMVTGIAAGRGLLHYGWLPAVLLGVLLASQTLVTYPIVSRLGLAKQGAVAVAIGATILTDVLALLVLAVTARLAHGAIPPAYWLRLGAGFLLLASVSLWLLPRLGRWFSRTLPGDEQAGFRFLFASLLGISVLAQLAGLEPILGAFLAGLALNPLVPAQSRLMNRVQFAGHSLFIPVFLISVGMLMDWHALLGGANAWKIIGLLLVGAFGVKLAATLLMRPLFGYTRDQVGLMYGMVVNKAGVTLATALIGFHLGLFDQSVLNGAILVILTTCLAGAWITESRGRRLAQASESFPDLKVTENATGHEKAKTAVK